jgi:hypothetical protein
MLGEPGVERRRFKRIERTLNVQVGRFTARADLDWDIVTAYNLSAGGLLFSYDQPVTPATPLRFKIYTPWTEGPMEAQGIVVRSERPDRRRIAKVAVSFTEMDPENFNLIQQIVKQE